MTHQYTQEQIVEIVTCSTDFSYFMQKYLSSSAFVYEDDNTVKEDNALRYLLWKALFKSEQAHIALFPTAQAAHSAMQWLQRDLDLLPDWIRPGERIRSRDCIYFDNASKLWFKPASPYALKGLRVATLAMDANIENYQDVLNQYGSTVCSYGKEVITFKS